MFDFDPRDDDPRDRDDEWRDFITHRRDLDHERDLRDSRRRCCMAARVAGTE